MALDIDEDLLRQAMEFGGHRTKTAVVNTALEEYIRRRSPSVWERIRRNREKAVGLRHVEQKARGNR